MGTELSMGSVAGCDIQYFFAMDILRPHTNQMPRHSKVYRNLAAEYAPLQHNLLLLSVNLFTT